MKRCRHTGEVIQALSIDKEDLVAIESGSGAKEGMQAIGCLENGVIRFTWKNTGTQKDIPMVPGLPYAVGNSILSVEVISGKFIFE